MKIYLTIISSINNIRFISLNLHIVLQGNTRRRDLEEDGSVYLKLNYVKNNLIES